MAGAGAKATPVRRWCAPARTVGDRCPGVLRLHESQDGLLARIRLPGGRVSADQLDAIAGAGSELGSGIVELTSRANLQLRGLRAGAREELQERLRAAGLLPSVDHDHVRNVMASPLAGRTDGTAAGEDADALVAALVRELCADDRVTALSGRFLFAVDDGSGLLLGPRADVVLAPAQDGGWQLLLAGRPASAEARSAVEAADLAVDAARAFLDVRGDGMAWRIAELDNGPERVARAIGAELTGPPTTGTGDRVEPGTTTQRDGRIAVTALAPLGRLEPGQTARLAEVVREHGDGELRVSPWRSVTLVDRPAEQAATAQAALDAIGLVARSGTGWSRLSACPGIAGCAKARLDVRRGAARRAAMRGPDAPVEHWSGCERCCGMPRETGVAAVGGDGGVTVTVDGEERTVSDLDAALAVLGKEAA
jgi:precorrin-3B synthase